MNLRDLCEFISKNECSLFIGAGASVEGGGPTGDALITEIKKKFSYVGDETDFFRVFDKAIKPDNSERAKVENFMRSILISIRPTQNHRYLFSIPWNAVITTNYDRIPELIPSTLDEKRMIMPRYNEMGDIKHTNPEHLYVLKLFGDTSHHYPEKGCMVLNNSDRRRAYNIQEHFFRVLKILAKSGNIIYLGYSFEDDLIFEILEEMLVELKGFPHKGYAISPTEPDESKMDRMKKYNIEWIEGTLDEFIYHCKDFFGEVPKSTSIKINPIKVHGNIIELDRDTFSNIRNKFSIVHQGSFTTDIVSPKYFFEGKDRSLVPFHYNFDFPRTLLYEYVSKESHKDEYKNIEQIISNRKITGNPADNMKFSIIGSVGSGKTVVGKRISYDWYGDGNPVIFIDTNSNYIDILAIESLINEIWEKYQSCYEEGEIIPPIRYLVVCDDGHYLIHEVDRMFNYLMSQGKPIDVLLIDRKSDLTSDDLKSRNYDVVYSIEDKVTVTERDDFIKHFAGLGVLSDLSALKYNLENQEINKSFFALMYTTIKEVQKPLKEYIIEEYNSRDVENKSIYELISLLQSYGLKSYRNIISNATSISNDAIKNTAISGQLNGIININDNNDYYYTNHRIIADIITEKVFNTPDMLSNGLLRLINSITENIYEEMKLIHNLLINRKEIQNKLSDGQMETLYIAASKTVKTRPLFHHLAKNQLQQSKFQECRTNLGLASKSVNGRFPEKIANLYDTYGRLELAISKVIEDETIKWDHLEAAEEYFRRAKPGTILEDPHPVLGLAQTYFEMSKMQIGIHKLRFCLRSLYNLNNLKHNARRDFHLGQTIALERDIFDFLMDSKLDDELAQLIYDETKNANGYAFLSEMCIFRNDVENALDYVNRGLALDASSVWLIRIKVNLLLEMKPNPVDEIYDALLLYLKQSEQFYDIHLSFELGKLQFSKNEWELSRTTFRTLDGMSKGYRNRLIPRPQDRLMDNSKPRKIIGTIINVPVRNRRGEIRSINPIIPFNIRVYIRSLDYERCRRGDRVSFEIVFNMRGPEASRVRKI